jgi:hypothetical protein
MAIMTPSRHMEIPMLATVRMVRRRLRQQFFRTRGRYRNIAAPDYNGLHVTSSGGRNRAFPATNRRLRGRQYRVQPVRLPLCDGEGIERRLGPAIPVEGRPAGKTIASIPARCCECRSIAASKLRIRRARRTLFVVLSRNLRDIDELTESIKNPGGKTNLAVDHVAQQFGTRELSYRAVVNSEPVSTPPGECGAANRRLRKRPSMPSTS